MALRAKRFTVMGNYRVPCKNLNGKTFSLHTKTFHRCGYKQLTLHRHGFVLSAWVLCETCDDETFCFRAKRFTAMGKVDVYGRRHGLSSKPATVEHSLRGRNVPPPWVKMLTFHRHGYVLSWGAPTTMKHPCGIKRSAVMGASVRQLLPHK